MNRTKTLSISVMASLFSAELPANTEIEELQKQIQTLQAQLEQTSSSVNVLMNQAGGGSATTLGGYGEMHYTNIETQTDGAVSNKSKEIDFHRFVLFLNHEFSSSIRFYSELELEHAIAGGGSATTCSDSNDDGNLDTCKTGKNGKVGEIELEQAYIEFDLNQYHNAKGGLFLIPVGIINETHEPTTFYGVERNPVEKDIIPTTWWEGGAGLNGEMAPGWHYDLAIHSGLYTVNGDIRGGRQKVGEATANDWAMTGRVKYSAIAGTELAVTLQRQTDLAQGTNPDKNSATLIETHLVWNRGPFGIKTLYASWNIDGSAPKAAGKDKQKGYYIEGSYKVLPNLGLFARYNSWDKSAGDSVDSEAVQSNIGLNWWPHEDVVLKLDLEKYEKGATEKSGFNAGIGYQF